MGLLISGMFRLMDSKWHSYEMAQLRRGAVTPFTTLDSGYRFTLCRSSLIVCVSCVRLFASCIPPDSASVQGHR
jgi:hypothetical protein